MKHNGKVILFFIAVCYRLVVGRLQQRLGKETEVKASATQRRTH